MWYRIHFFSPVGHRFLSADVLLPESSSPPAVEQVNWMLRTVSENKINHHWSRSFVEQHAHLRRYRLLLRGVLLSILQVSSCKLSDVMEEGLASPQIF